MPRSHDEAYVAVKHGTVTFNVECVSGSGGGTVVVYLNTPGYTEIPENSSAWYPSGDQHDPSVYQGSTAMPDLCGGSQMTLKDGGTFSADVFSTDTLDALHFRFHYSANGTSGSGSAT